MFRWFVVVFVLCVLSFCSTYIMYLWHYYFLSKTIFWTLPFLCYSLVTLNFSFMVIHLFRLVLFKVTFVIHISLENYPFCSGNYTYLYKSDKIMFYETFFHISMIFPAAFIILEFMFSFLSFTNFNNGSKVFISLIPAFILVIFVFFLY